MRDGGGCRAQCVRVDLVPLPNSGDDYAPRFHFAVRMQDDGRPELALQLAAVGKALQPALELPIELARAVRECARRASRGIGDRKGVGFALARRLDFDRDLPHRVAIVSEVQGFTVSLRNEANPVQL